MIKHSLEQPPEYELVDRSNRILSKTGYQVLKINLISAEL